MPKNSTPSRATEAPRKTTVSAPAASRRGTPVRPSTSAAEDLDPRETAKRKLLSQPDPAATRLSPAERREQARRAARATSTAKPPLPKK